MSDQQALAGFLDKWTARWPEWRIAEVFAPPAQRAPAIAWFTLRDELLHAAWGGSDPRPGEAKLGWWAEELHGWSQGRRRHPLGLVLQPLSAPWTRLAVGIPSLMAAREPATTAEDAYARLKPICEGIVAVDAALFAGDGSLSLGQVTAQLLAQSLQLRGDDAVPLQIRARMAAAPDADTGSRERAGRTWAAEVLERWGRGLQGAHAEGILAALQRERLRRFALGRPMARALSPWTTLWIAWRAARGVRVRPRR